MARKKRPFNLRSRITSALRRIWLYSPQRRLAVMQAKADNNRCTSCRKPQEKCDIDHILECVPLTGWDGNWTAYIERLMDGQLTWLCKPCHSKKTAFARAMRHNIKKQKLAKRKRKKK